MYELTKEADILGRKRGSSAMFVFCCKLRKTKVWLAPCHQNLEKEINCPARPPSETHTGLTTFLLEIISAFTNIIYM